MGLPVKSARATMMIVDVCLDCGDPSSETAGDGYRTSFVVEWSGWNTMHFTASSLKPVGNPGGLHTARAIRLSAGSFTFAGTVLELGAPAWNPDSPLIRVTPWEDMVVNFLSERMWDRSDWTRADGTTLPEGEGALEVSWMYANLRYLQKPGRRHRVAYTRAMNVDIEAYQAVTVFTATDIRANFSLVMGIDGAEVRAIDRRRGLGGGDEIRAPVSGRRLTAITLELEQAEDDIRDAVGVHVATAIRWILLERKGTDPAAVGEAWGTKPIGPPVRVGSLEAEVLPVGILIGREEFLALRASARNPGPLRKMADEIIAEAEDHAGYSPERFVGRYLPVDLGNQGCERRASPSDQMYHYNSCMVYGAVAYALTGDLRHGQTARRALFSALRCATWQAGFASRIPCGLPGYRAPFIEVAAAEAVALCYDFVHPLLSDGERREVEDALYEKALPWIDMYLRLYGEGYLLNSNQGAVYVSGLVSAALVARRSHPDVDGILDRGIRWFPRMINNYYKESGATNEGPGYWEYTTQYAASALVSIARHKGWSVRAYAPAHFERTVDYLLQVRSLAVDGLSFLPIGDNIEAMGFNYMNSSLMFFARHYASGGALWLWHEYFSRRPNPPGSSFFGKRMAGACSTSGLMSFLLFTDGAPVRPELPPAKQLEGCDRVVLRTGSRQGDVLFLFEGGPQTFDHTHSDKGQFIMEAHGERFAADPGVIRYQDPAHIYFKDTSYHNLVTLGGRNQDYRDPKNAVVLDRVSFGPRCDLICADLRNSYKAFSRYSRRIVFVRPHYFVVVDEVLADEPGLEWNYHSLVPFTQIDMASGLVRLQGSKAAMTLAVGSPSPLKAVTGAYRSGATVLCHNLVLTQVAPSRSLALAALLLPFPSSGVQAPTDPRVSVRRQKSSVIFEVTGGWGTDRVECDLERDETRERGGPPVRIRRSQGRDEETILEMDA
jgi:Heparinase II/III-like protein